MKRIITALLCAASLGLSGCEASLSSSAVKGSLEGKGYSVSVYTKAEAEAAIKGIEYVVNITDALVAAKDQTDAFIGFFCANISEAEKFMNTNIAAMVHWAEDRVQDPKVGFHNNVAYAGSYDAVATAGIPVTK